MAQALLKYSWRRANIDVLSSDAGSDDMGEDEVSDYAKEDEPSDKTADAKEKL